ncbi:MAG TPA: hypothetical protein VHE80_06080 [Acidimicrobiales bacterium]|nr:hypothetical protein [Acidimicrobiales bacterium]
MPKLLALTSLVLAGVLATVAPASAAGKPKVDFDGHGTYTMAGDGSAGLTGTGTGEPFDGSYVAALAASDGTLPDPGSCEAATATVTLQGPRGRFLELAATGDVCGRHLQSPYVVTQLFTGRYEVVSAWQKRFLGSDGFLEVYLATDGRAGVVAIDT